MWIKREISRKLRELSKKKQVILLTGPRQTGKSSLLKKLFPKIRYISLDRPSTAHKAEHSGEEFLKEFQEPVIIDEIQNAPSLFKHIKYVVDQNRKRQFFLTGSQKFQLMARASESLAGRVVLLELHSLSVTELKNHFQKKPKSLIELMFKGGYPEVWAGPLSMDDFFSSYISSYIQKDIRQIINVKNLYDFDRFISLLATRAGQLLNYNSLSSDMGVSAGTIKLWMNALEASNIIFILKPFYKNLGKRLIKTPKIYFMDSGLLCYLMGFRSQKELKNSSLLGSLFENFVLSQMIRKESNKAKTANLFFYRDQWGCELDFVRPVGEKLELYECKWAGPRKTNLKAFSEIESLIGKKNIISKNIFYSGEESYHVKDYHVISLTDKKFA